LLENEDTITTTNDWDDAFVTHSAAELRAVVAARRANKQNSTKESVTISYSPEVLAFFRNSSKDWQTLMNTVLCDYVAKQHGIGSS